MLQYFYDQRSLLMKKKIIYIVIILIVALLFSACMNNNDPQLPISSETAAETDTETSSESAEKSGEDDEKGFVFMYEGHEIYMGMPEEEIQQLDGYDLVSGNGIPEVIDNRYKFKGFFVDCSKWFLSNNAMVVSMIYFIDNSVETAEGIRLGDSLEKVRDTYKNDEVYYSSEHEIHYLRDNSILTFSFTDNKVTEILYELYEEQQISFIYNG